ncbi:MAG TPA: tryptophan 2,3-dioxygenase family protein, partial [Acidimicrobiales bacterium]
MPTEPPAASGGDYAGAADAHLDLSHSLSYAEYLGLDAVLSSQRPRTDAHDEMLFIIQHQATEVWVKL